VIGASGAIFVDTSAWFESIIPSEAHHLIATEWLRRNKQPLLTTDFVVDETLTLLRARDEDMSAKSLGAQLFEGELALVYYLTEEDIHAAWQVFRSYDDKGWSLPIALAKL